MGVYSNVPLLRDFSLSCSICPDGNLVECSGAGGNTLHVEADISFCGICEEAEPFVELNVLPLNTGLGTFEPHMENVSTICHSI